MLWRTARTTWLALLLVASACSSSTGPVGPATASSSLHGEVTDPVGDALADPRVPTSPDLVHATADVTAGSLTFVIIQFAPGTLDRQTTRVSLLLDTDQDGSTGISQADGIGADYSVDLAAGTSQAAVNKADPVSCAARLSCFTSVGTVPLTFVTDGMQVTVPLSLLGNDDGRMSVQMNSYVLVAPLTAVLFDFMPDNHQAPGRIQ